MFKNIFLLLCLMSTLECSKCLIEEEIKKVPTNIIILPLSTIACNIVFSLTIVS